MNDKATIKIFLTHGDAKGVRTAEISNWSGKAIAGPRSQLGNLLSREELGKPGVYILLGTDLSSGGLAAYIGEAEAVRERLKQHKAKAEDYWNEVIAFVSKDDNLTKSHIRYLEGRLIQIAKDVGRYVLINTVSSGAKLPESDRSDMDAYLERVAQLLPVLGSELITPVIDRTLDNQARLILTCKRKDAVASGMRTNKGFVVFKDSTAILELKALNQDGAAWIVALRQQLIINRDLEPRDGRLVFTRDVEFASPSAAAAMVYGGVAAGPLAWKDASGKTLKELESV